MDSPVSVSVPSLTEDTLTTSASISEFVALFKRKVSTGPPVAQLIVIEPAVVVEGTTAKDENAGDSAVKLYSSLNLSGVDKPNALDVALKLILSVAPSPNSTFIDDIDTGLPEPIIAISQPFLLILLFFYPLLELCQPNKE